MVHQLAVIPENPARDEGASFGLLEMGSNSLKFYLVGPKVGVHRPIETQKFPWRVSHEYFRSGSIGSDAESEILECIRGVERVARGVPLASMIAIATGVFRELPTMERIARRVSDETGVRIRVISGEDEAGLMAKGFQKQLDVTPSVFCDLGGATMEWVWMKTHRYGRWGSLPIGAIRNEYLFRSLEKQPSEYVQKSSSYCDCQLSALPFDGKVSVVFTGGTAKAATRVVGSDTVPIESVREMIASTLEHGPPERLKPARREVFLPGLVVLWRVLVRCRAREFRFTRDAVRHGMVLRLLKLLEKMPRQQLHATLLLRSSSLGNPENATPKA